MNSTSAEKNSARGMVTPSDVAAAAGSTRPHCAAVDMRVREVHSGRSSSDAGRHRATEALATDPKIFGPEKFQEFCKF